MLEFILPWFLTASPYQILELWQPPGAVAYCYEYEPPDLPGSVQIIQLVTAANLPDKIAAHEPIMITPGNNHECTGTDGRCHQHANVKTVTRVD